MRNLATFDAKEENTTSPPRGPWTRSPSGWLVWAPGAPYSIMYTHTVTIDYKYAMLLACLYLLFSPPSTAHRTDFNISSVGELQLRILHPGFMPSGSRCRFTTPILSFGSSVKGQLRRGTSPSPSGNINLDKPTPTRLKRSHTARVSCVHGRSALVLRQ